MNPNDELRAQIIRYFYDVHAGIEPSENGRVTGAAAGSAMRQRLGKHVSATFGGNLE